MWKKQAVPFLRWDLFIVTIKTQASWMWERLRRELPVLPYLVELWVTFYVSATHTHSLKRICENVCIQCMYAHSTLDGPHANSHSSLRLSHDRPTTWKTVSDSLKLVCANKAHEVSLSPCPAPRVQGQLPHRSTVRPETQAASLSRHFMICLLFAGFFWFCSVLEWGGSGCNVTILIQ